MQTTLSSWKPANEPFETKSKTKSARMYESAKYTKNTFYNFILRAQQSFSLSARGFSVELAALNVLDRQLGDLLARHQVFWAWPGGAACLKSPKLAQPIKLINWSRSLSVTLTLWTRYTNMTLIEFKVALNFMFLPYAVY